MKRKIYRLEICASNDSCEEYWEFIPLSEFYNNREDVERIKKKYENLNSRELEKLANVLSVRSNKPQVIEYTLFEM